MLIRRPNTDTVKTKQDASKIFRGAQSFMSANPGLVYHKGSDWWFLYQSGMYKKIEDCEIRRMILETESIPEIQEWTYNQHTQLVNTCKALRHYGFDDFNQTDLMNFKNCFLDLDSLETVEHSHDFISTFQLPYSYEPEAQSDLWVDTVNKIMGEDQEKIKLIQEFFGYCLTMDCRYEKALFLVGVSRSGKSTILSALKHMLGKENFSSLPLQMFMESHSTAALIGKLANIVGELPNKAGEYTDIFKAITSGEEITINEKHGRIYNEAPYCKLVFAGNDMPHIGDSSDAIYERLIFIELLDSIPASERDPQLRFKLKDEVSGIFNWALDGLKRLRKQNGFSQVKEVSERIEQLKEDNNPILQYVADEYVVTCNDDDYILKDDMFERFQTYARDNNLKSRFTKRNFGREFKKLMGKQVNESSRWVADRTKRVWIGIKQRTGYEDVQSNETVNWDD